MTSSIAKKLVWGFIFFCMATYSFRAHAQEPQKKTTGVDIIITQSPKILVKVERVTDNTCFGESKGAINISAYGGYPPYKYSWSSGDTTQDIAGLKSGKYKVAVYDNFSCSDTVEVEVSQPDRLVSKVESIKHILCYGYNNGAVDIKVSGGKLPYSYSWSNGSKSEDLDGVNSGRYSVLITDGNACQDIVTADVLEKPLIVRSVDDVTNIKCHGDSTGTVDISVSGGVPPYTYHWNNGATTEDLRNLVAGTYEVVVKDAESCTEVSQANVVEPGALAITFEEITNLRCNGDFGGAINLKVEGGKKPYKYKWNNGSVNQDIAGVQAGDYKVQVVDNNGCETSISTKLTEPDALTVSLDNVKNVLNHGGKNGSIDISVAGGVPNYKYKWSNESTNQDISELAAGNYSVRVTDASGCAKIMNVTITEPSPLVVRLDNTKDVSCFGEKTGAVNISVIGGIAPYNYKWNNGESTEDIAALPSGKYAVVVTDANGHTQTLETTIKQPELFKASVTSVTDILCFGENTGAIDINVSGGVQPYRYRWASGQATQDLSRVGAGDYSVKIVDANQCEQEVTASIKQPERLDLSFASTTNIKCHGDATGAVDALVKGGVSPYKYKWSNGAESEDLSGLKAGSYNVLVTDAKGCTNQLEAKITEPTLLLLEERSVKNVDCYSNKTGSINLTVGGGVTPYKYSWSSGDSTLNIANKPAGNYSLRVKDANGCVATYSKEVTQPSKLVRSVNNVADILCNGDSKGAVNINVSGGMEPYSYRWSNGATTQDIVDVRAGSYSVLIRDANGCTDSLSAVVKENPALTSKLKAVNIKCFGQKSGTINLVVEGGVAPYKYKWSNGSTLQDIAGLVSGNYSVLITDAKGCTDSKDAQISEPPRFVASLESDRNLNCFGQNEGAVNVRVSGGVTPYHYKWSNGDTTRNVAGLPVGKYTLTASDANGCIQTVTTTLTQPPKINYSVKSVRDVLCYGEKEGAIDIAVSGGIGPFTYKWNNEATTQDIQGIGAGRYKVQITDGNGCVNSLEAEIKQPESLIVKLDTVVNIKCNGDKLGAINIDVTGGVAPYSYTWSNGAVTQDVKGLNSGVYTVTVFDAKGCTKTITTKVSEPPPLVATLGTVKHINCYGQKLGAISINVTGGAQPYTFAWTNGASTKDLSNVAAGTYTVNIKDKNGCTQTITATINQPIELISKLTQAKNVSCYQGSDGAINVTVTGGTVPYTYKWNNGADTQDLMNIKSGSYALTIVDANGCRDSTIRTTLKEPTLLNASIQSVSDIARYGENSGSITINVSGGVSPYKYSWSNGAVTQNLAGVPGGSYSVLILDANGCERNLTANIKQPPALTVDLISVQDIKCFGNRSGAISIKVNGGVKPYVYKWNSGDSTQNISNVPAGDYSVVVTDASGFHQTVTAKINQPSQLVLKEDAVKNLLCFNDRSGAINVTVTGGVEPYKYAWSSGQTVQDIASLSAGSYTLNVVDNFGCKVSLTTQVVQPDSFNISVADVKHIMCMGDRKGEVHLNVRGGVTPYSYYWNNGLRTKDMTGVGAGKYSVKVSDANGCVNNVSTTINEPSKLQVAIQSVIDNNCFGENKGAINLSVSGGTTPYSYAWSNGNGSQNLTNAPKGQYSVVVTDANGCAETVGANITEPSSLFSSIDAVKHVNCFGDKTGSVTISVSGGSMPYSYVWNNGTSQQNITQVPAGDYQVSVKDSKGCVKTLSTTINQPQKLHVELDTIFHVLCNGDSKGNVDVAVSGGTMPYQYTWSNGANSEDLVNVLAGSYTLRVGDAKGCDESLSVNIKQPQKLMLVLDSTKNIKCSGQAAGMVSIHATGGVEPYSYNWSNGSSANRISGIKAGEYVATVTDRNGCLATYTAEIQQPTELIKTIDAITDIRCHGDSTGSIYVTVREGVAPYTFNWSNGSASEDIRGLKAGNYKLTITEANGCQSFLEASIEQPTAFAAKVAEVKNIECFGNTTGAIHIDVSGGVEPYGFTWSNGAKTKDVDDVGADSYSVMVSDANGCLNTLHAQITEPEMLELRIDSVYNVKCCGDNSGAIFISVTGGVKPYKYEWSNGATTQDIRNLVLGVYTVNVTDANGCMVSTPDNMSLYEQVVSKGMFTTRDINFDVGKSTIRPESFTTINRIASFMKEHQDISFRIDGHTDSDGSADFNQRLSQDRANAIRIALIKFGIRENRLESKGWGEAKPIASNDTTNGKSQNRRVEFIALTGTFEGTLIEPEGTKGLPK